MDTIYFNCKSKRFYKLSNFYGGVENNYMRDRFLDPEVQELFDDFEACSVEEFQDYLRLLQPQKKWNDRKLLYYVRDGRPIRGILSQLAGTSVRKNQIKRLTLIKSLCNLSEKVQIKEELSDDAKQELMLRLLKIKFQDEEYKDELLKTGNAVLHERPMRGKANDWTYRAFTKSDGSKGEEGKDWMGKLLMQVREELRNQ